MKRLATQTLCALLSFLMAFQPLLTLAADITVDTSAPAANQATVTTAPNDVPLINIVAPNGAGLSHNKFTDYNVTSSGLILNNSTAMGASQLGGILMANPNFGGVAATKILNEVTGSSRSQLKGFTEVFGSKADVIVANQNGITCNGCGFINTGRATLTTGAPTFTGNDLTGFDVDAGDVAIEGLGLNANDADAFDIISRSATIAASLNAQEANLTLGRNTVDYDTRTATAKVDDGSDKPSFALDSSALGGMYAGRIAIVATEDGVGVNMGGEAAASTGNMTLTADGKIVLATATAKGDLSVTSNSADIEAGTKAYAEGDTTLTAATGLDVSGSETGAAGDATLSGSSITATDAQVIAGLQSDGTMAATGTLTANTAGALTYGSGQLAAGAAVDITAGSTSGSGGSGGSDPTGINSSGTITVNATTVSDTGGGIQATGDITVNATTMTASDGDVESTTGAVDLNITGTLTNDDQRISAKTTLTANAADIVNNGQINAEGALTLTATDDLTNTGFIYIPGDLALYAGNTLLNDEGDILASDNITLQGDAVGNNATLVSNLSGSIEALTGDITIKADTLNNERKNLTTTTVQAPEETTTDTNMSAYSSSDRTKLSNLGLITTDSNGNIAWVPLSGRGWSGTSLNVDEAGIPQGPYVSLYQNGYVVKHNGTDKWAAPTGEATVTVEYVQTDSSSSSPAPTIAAGSNLTIAAATTENTGGRLSANGNLAISGSTLTNSGFDETKNSTSSATKINILVGYTDPHDEGGPQGAFNYPGWTTTTSTTSEVTSTTNAVISAADTFTGSFTDQVDNVTIVEGGDLKDIKEGSDSALAKTLDFGAVDLAALTAGITIPTGSNSLFIAAQAPGSNYLVETNPVFADMGAFMGTDYFFDNAGIDKNAATKRLGDAFYETKLIREEIFARTNKRYLSDTVTSDADQMQALMDSALAQKDGLALSLGVALTAEQVTALTGDMLWWVEVEIEGETVLRPVLYLADATRAELTPSGAIITANSLTLDAETLANSGALLSDTTLAATVTDSIVNRYGDIEGKDDLTLTAANDITNTGGRIASDGDIDLTATDGSIVNQAEVRTETTHFQKHGRWKTQDGNLTGWTEGLAAKGRIQSGGDLGLSAGSDITNRAGNLTATGDIALTAGDDIALASQSTDYLYFTQERVSTDDLAIYNTKVTGTKRQSGTVSAGGALTVDAGGDLTIEGTSLSSTGDATLSAGNDLTIASASQSEKRDYEGSDELYLATTDETASQITAGTNLTATAGGDLSISASSLEAGNDIALTGTTGVDIAAAAETYKQFTFRRETTHKAAEIEAGGDVSISATLGDVSVLGSKIKGTDTSLNALGSVTVDAVQNITETRGYDGDFITETYQLRHQGAEVEAANDLTLNSTLGNVTVDTSALKSGGTTTLNATTGKVELLASKDVDYTRTYGTSNDGLWITTVDRGSYDETVKHTTIDAGGGLVINAGQGITVEYKGGGGIDGAIDALSKQDGLAWMAEIKGRNDVTWNAVQEAHRSWDYSSQNLNPAAGAVIAIAVSIATANPAAAIAGNITSNATMAAALKAGMMSLASSASVSLVANKGDLGATLKDLGSSATLRSLASAMVTAGLLEGVLPADLKGDFSKLELTEKVQKLAIQASVGTLVQGTVGGQDLGDAAKSQLTTAATELVGSYVFEKIGDLGLDDGHPLKAMAHGVAGGLINELAGGEFTSGAIAAASAEMFSTALEGIEDPNMRVQMSGLIAATAVALSGGDAFDVQLANRTAQMVATYNHEIHPDFKKKMDEVFKEKKAEDPDAFAALDQNKLTQLQNACGESHCFEGSWFSNLDTQRLKDYAAAQNLTFSDAEISTFETLYSSAETALRNDLAELNWTNSTEVPGNEAIVDNPLYIPDQNDRNAAIWLLQEKQALPDDIATGLDEAEWAEFKAQFEAELQANPALKEAVKFAKSQQTEALIEFTLAGMAGEAAPAILARIVAATRVAKGIQLNTATISGKTCVYHCQVDGITRYVGITDDIARRGYEHMKNSGMVIDKIEGLSNLSREDARAVEQVLISFHGLGKDGGTLINKINSISPVTNKTKYETALVRGAEILKQAGYKGF